MDTKACEFKQSMIKIKKLLASYQDPLVTCRSCNMDTWACEIIRTNLNLACDLTCDKEPGNEYSMYRNFVIAQYYCLYRYIIIFSNN